MGNSLNEISINALQKSLDAVWLRQKVISNNIANAETPGYKSYSVVFEDVLNSAIDGRFDDPDLLQNAFEMTDPYVVQDKGTTAGQDGNNVNLDKENIELARAQLQYSYLVQTLNSEINRLKYAINGGK